MFLASLIKSPIVVENFRQSPSVVKSFLTLRFLEFSGMTGILSGMVVAFKQIKPEQEISLSSLGLRVKVGLD